MIVRFANWKIVFWTYAERSNNFIDSVNKPFAEFAQGKSWVDLYSGAYVENNFPPCKSSVRKT